MEVSMQELIEIVKSVIAAPGGIQALVLIAGFALAGFAIYAVLKASKEGS
jgi:hypothetical protein